MKKQAERRTGKTIAIIITVITAAAILFGLPGCSSSNQNSSGSAEAGLKGTISVSGAWALYPMAVKWAEEFQKINPEVQIDISAGGAGKGMADALADIVDIGMVSRKIYQEEIDKGAWWVAVTKDAVVPVINSANPVIEELLMQGVKRDTFIEIWINGNIKDWKDIVLPEKELPSSTEIHIYTRSDSCGAGQVWAEFLGGNQEDLLGTGIYGDPGLLEAVKNDELGIGYNNINYAYDPDSKTWVEGTRVLPVDINGNGKIDEDENIYDELDTIIQAIQAGKYPSPPARDLYFVCSGKPEKDIVVEFIRWILTDGQKFVHETGYINLTEEKIAQELSKITE